MSENPKAAIDKKVSHRVIAYVDGYNLYCAVKKWAKKGDSNLVKYHLENLVLHCLEEESKKQQSENLINLIKINFYTARPLKIGKGGFSIKHYEEWTGRQKCLDIVKVIEGIHVSRRKSTKAQTDINIVMGMYKKDDPKKARQMELTIKKIIEEIYRHKYEEKQTDVNIAVDMISGALKNSYDKAVLISDDTDFWRLILKCLRAGKHVLVLGTEEPHPVKKRIDNEEKIEHYSAKLRKDISELRQYMNNGTLDFYRITKDDIKQHPDRDYIKEPSDNKGNNKKQR